MTLNQTKRNWTPPQGGMHKRRRLAFLTIGLIVATVSSPASTAGTEPTVVTTTGTFTAVASASDARVNVFFGIRYAAPPVGPRRWQPPQAPNAPAGVVVAASPGNACPQESNTGPLPQSEDCLFLNVYVPASAGPSSRLPVLYWIHGGGLVNGTGVEYDPAAMVAEHNIIVVTINYRLGALGWLVEPALLAPSANSFQNMGDSGDYGLMDQQFGLQWVQANIENFGGDPTKVTIAGESAGGLSVLSLLASTDTAAGLFRGVIVESGARKLYDLPSQAAYETTYGARFSAALGCSADDAACLRSQPIEQILNAQKNVFGAGGISPDFGTRILPRDPWTAVTTGRFIQVPVLQGSNANEGRLFEPKQIPFAASNSIVAMEGGPANFDLSNPNTFCATSDGAPAVCSYLQEINLYLGKVGVSPTVNTTGFDELIAAQYPLINFQDPFLPNNASSADEALAQIYTDRAFACNTFDANSALAQWVRVFAYEFNDATAPPLVGSVYMKPNDQFGFPTASEHTAELQFLFNSKRQLSAGEQELAEEMKTYWANFVISGDPNSSSATVSPEPWQPFNMGLGVEGLIPGPAVPEVYFTFFTEHFCSIWQPLPNAQ